MWRALTLLVVLLLGAGVYALVTGGTATSSPEPAPGTTTTQFGYALAAGAVALAATLLVGRPRMRFRR